MKVLFGYVLFFLLSIQISFGQAFLIDSSSLLTLFGGTQSSLNFKKYQYDDQYRILQISSLFQIKDYIYQNEFDHSIFTHNPQTNLFSPREDNFYNEDGLIIIQERHAHNSQSQEYTLEIRKLFEYNQENRLTKELHYSYGEGGEEHLINSYDYSYIDGKLINKLQIYYVLASPYTTTSTNYEYSGPYLVAEEQEKNSGGNQTKYFKSLEYNNDNSLKSSVTYFLNGIDTTNRANVNYVHTDSGTETHSSYFSYNTNTYHYYEEYNSFVESPFYEKDSFINIIYLNDFETATESRFNSAQYSITGDSAFVRRENVIEDPQFSSFLQITKDVYIKYEGAPTEVIDEELKVATVFPCPASKGSTIIIHKMNADVDRVELYNLLGQKVDCIYLGDQTQTIVIAPQKAGNYYLVYFDDNQRIGQVEKLVIK